MDLIIFGLLLLIYQVTPVSTGGHVQSLLSGYKRINIPLNPECSQGRAKAAAQYSPLCLSLLFGSTILELYSFLSLSQEMEQWRGCEAEGKGQRGREKNELGLAFDVLIGRGLRTAAALTTIPGESRFDS